MSKLMSAAEVMRQFGYARSSLIRWEKQGKITAYKLPGGQRRYDPSDFASFKADAGEAATASETPPLEMTPMRAGRGEMGEMGAVGINKWKPSLFDEKVPELRGTRGLELLHEMRINDPIINATFMAIENAMRQSSWRVAPASESGPDRAAAEFIDSCLLDLTWSWHDQMTFILEMLEMGVSILEVVYKRRLGMSPPRYVKDPAHSMYNDGRVGWRKWAPRSLYTLDQGDGWDIDDKGSIQGVRQSLPSGVNAYIPIEKLLLFRTTVSPANSPLGMPIHRSMYTSWWYSSNLMEIEGIGVERDLNGIPIVYLGSDCSKADYDMAVKLVQNIRMDEQAGIVIPKAKMGTGALGQGMLIELLSSNSRRSYDTSAIIERYDRRKCVAVLAQFIMLGMGQTGSYALSRHQGDLFSLAVGAWLQSIAGVINRIAIPRLMRYNAFQGITGMPRAEPSGVGIPKLEEVASYIDKMVGANVLKPDDELERHVRQLADLPEKGRDQSVPTVRTGEAAEAAGVAGDEDEGEDEMVAAGDVAAKEVAPGVMAGIRNGMLFVRGSEVNA